MNTFILRLVICIFFASNIEASEVSLSYGSWGLVLFTEAGQTGTICDDSFDQNDNGCAVICRMLSYSHGIHIDRCTGGDSYPILLDNVACTGSETDVYDCPRNDLGNHNCAHSEDVGCFCCDSDATCNGRSDTCGAPCSDTPCLNGAACEDDGVSVYTCTCADGYEGTNCETELPRCSWDSPCQNGATCSDDGTHTYTCQCDTGYEGTNCETESARCSWDSPCQNGGTCSDSGSHSYTCTCDIEYDGTNCENEAPACEWSTPCMNNGTCSDDGTHAYSCECSEGFYGDDCENEGEEDNEDNGNDNSAPMCQRSSLALAFAMFIDVARRVFS